MSWPSWNRCVRDKQSCALKAPQPFTKAMQPMAYAVGIRGTWTSFLVRRRAEHRTLLFRARARFLTPV